MPSMRMTSVPIINLEKCVRGGHVLTYRFDSLPDPAVASAIGAIFLADLAALAGSATTSETIGASRS